MTAKQRRERDVERMAKRMCMATGPLGSWHEVARYVLRLLAARGRASLKGAAERANKALRYGTEGPRRASVAKAAILRGGRP